MTQTEREFFEQLKNEDIEGILFDDLLIKKSYEEDENSSQSEKHYIDLTDIIETFSHIKENIKKKIYDIQTEIFLNYATIKNSINFIQNLIDDDNKDNKDAYDKIISESLNDIDELFKQSKEYSSILMEYKDNLNKVESFITQCKEAYKKESENK